MNKKLLATVLQVSGACAICLGAGVIFLPGGIMLAGIFAVLFGLALERANAE
jgi:hypothetical protein